VKKVLFALLLLLLAITPSFAQENDTNLSWIPIHVIDDSQRPATQEVRADADSASTTNLPAATVTNALTVAPSAPQPPVVVQQIVTVQPPPIIQNITTINNYYPPQIVCPAPVFVLPHIRPNTLNIPTTHPYSLYLGSALSNSAAFGFPKN